MQVAELSARVRWQIAFTRIGTYALLFAPALILGEMLQLALRTHSLAFDAASSYLPAARDLLKGDSPYHPADVARGVAFASPPVAAFLFTPFTLLPHAAAEVAMSMTMLASGLAALRIMGVRDWRCFAVASISAPLVGEFQTANLSALMALCAALLWRYRDRPMIAAAAAGTPVALKLLGWPMIVFLFATRRFKAAALSVVFAAVGTLIPWAAIGFAGMGGYPHLLASLMRAERGHVYSFGALIAPFSSWVLAGSVTCLIGLVLLVLAFRAQGSAQTFIVCVAATLVFTPVIWMHYFVLLLVVIALAAPQLGLIWLMPLALWLSAREGPLHAWQTVFVLALEAGIFVAAVKVRGPALWSSPGLLPGAVPPRAPEQTVLNSL
jgi:hypothetical protein